jgi:hypothetical protein
MRKKFSLIVGVVMVFFLITSVAASQEGAKYEYDIIGADPMGLCVDDECSAIWLPPPEPNNPLGYTIYETAKLVHHEDVS